MTEYLNRQELLKALAQDQKEMEEDYFPDEDPSSYNAGWIDGYAAAVGVISCIRAADVRSLRRGEWKIIDPFDDHEVVKCSECGYVMEQETPYCPNCSARMSGEDEQP